MGIQRMKDLARREAKRAKLIKACNEKHSLVDECPDPMDNRRTLRKYHEEAFGKVLYPCEKCGCYAYRKDGDNE